MSVYFEEEDYIAREQDGYVTVTVERQLHNFGKRTDNSNHFFDIP